MELFTSTVGNDTKLAWIVLWVIDLRRIYHIRRFHACTQLVPGVYSTHYMTEYGVSHSEQLTDPSHTVQERKAARKKLLDEIWQRRRENYKHLMHNKRKLQESGEVV